MLIKSLYILLFSIKAFACLNIDAPKELNLSVSTANESISIFDDSNTILDETPSLNASYCVEAAKKKRFLMFTTGIENFVHTDKYLTFSINDTVTFGSKDQCRIENAPIAKGLTKEERNKRLSDRRFLLNHCLSFNIEDSSETGLNIPEEQPGCKITKVDKNSANFFGFYCFFKPKPDSSFKITPVIDNKCLTGEIYKEKNFELQDILGSLELYIAGDTTGKSAQLEFLHDTKLRYSMSPAQLIPTNKPIMPEDPLWPSQWSVKNSEAGKIEIYKKSKKESELYAPIFVSNQCAEKSCKDGLCTSPCNYTQPVASENIIYDITKENKKEYLTSWFDGGIAPANWSGMINGTGINIKNDHLISGNRYQLETLLSDQDYNYMMFKGRIKSRLTINQNIPSINREGTTIGKINPIMLIQETTTLPSYPVFDAIRFTGENHVGVMNTVNSISRVFENTLWPTHLETYCTDTKCVRSSKHELTFITEFTVEKDEDNKVIFKDIVYKKKNNDSNMTTINNYEGPYFTCGNADDDGDDDDDWGDDLGDIDF